MAAQAFAVMREGMTGKAGIGKLALYGREYLVAVQPRENGLVMYTMRHSKEVRSMDAIDELTNVPTKVKPDEIKLAKQVIGNSRSAEPRGNIVTSTRKNCSGSSTRRSPAKRSSRPRRRPRPRSST